MSQVLIGRGAFTKAYLNTETNRVTLKSSCPIKECMAFGWFPESTLFPALTSVVSEVYEMDHYPKFRIGSLNAEGLAQYRALHKLYQTRRIPRNPHDSYSYWYKRFETELEGELSQLMCEALDACANCGSDIAFECSPRNVSFDAEGGLVLMDVFYSLSALKRVRGN